MAAHRFVAQEDILEGARQGVMRAGLAVGSRRSLVENVWRAPEALPFGLLEHVARLPKMQYIFFHQRHVEPERDGPEQISLQARCDARRSCAVPDNRDRVFLKNSVS